MGYTNLWYKDFSAVGNAAAGGANSLVGGAPSTNPDAGALVDLAGSVWSVNTGAVVSVASPFDAAVTTTPLYPALIPLPPAFSWRITARGKQGDQISIPVNFRLLDGLGTDGRGTGYAFNVGATAVWGGFSSTTGIAGLPATETITRFEFRQFASGICRTTVSVWPTTANPDTDSPTYTNTYSGTIPPNSRIAAEIPGRIVTLRWLKVEVDYDLPTGVPSDSLAPASINLSALNGLVPVGAGQFAWPDSSLTGGSGTLTMQRAYTAPNSIVRNLATVAINAYGNESVLPSGNLTSKKAIIIPTLAALPPGVTGFAYEGGGFLIPFVFPSGTTAIVAPGDVAVGSIPGLTLQPGQAYFIREYLSGTRIPCQSLWSSGQSNTTGALLAGSDQAFTPSTPATLGWAAAGTFSDPSPAPLGLWGTLDDATITPVAYIGDSKRRVLGGYFPSLGIPMIDLGMPSDTTLNISGPNGRLRRAFAATAPNLIIQTGINDIANSQTGLQAFRSALGILGSMPRSQQQIICTIDTVTGGTYTTLAGQTHAVSGLAFGEANEYNSLVRRWWPRVWDIWAATHDASTGKWGVTGGAWTTDGTHYTTLGETVARGAFVPSMLRSSFFSGSVAVGTIATDAISAAALSAGAVAEIVSGVQAIIPVPVQLRAYPFRLKPISTGLDGQISPFIDDVVPMRFDLTGQDGEPISVDGCDLVGTLTNAAGVEQTDAIDVSTAGLNVIEGQVLATITIPATAGTYQLTITRTSSVTDVQTFGPFAVRAQRK
jgi:hypothetical protein